jgi:transposase
LSTDPDRGVRSPDRCRIRSEAAFAHLSAPRRSRQRRRTHRHRLNRGGDSGANNALYVVVLGRLRYDTGIRAYAERRTQESLSKPEMSMCCAVGG